MRTLTLLAAFAAFAGLACAQNSAVSGPTLGFVLDAASKSAVPLIGLPGAALTAAPLDAGAPLAQVESSPAADSALALSAQDGSVLFLRHGLPPASIPGLPPAPDVMVFSPSGSHAALLYRDAGVIEVLEGLPLHPSRGLSVPLAVDGPLAALAISDTGLLLYADAGPGGSTVWLLYPGRAPIPVLSVGGHAAVAFVPRLPSALVSDPSAGLLYQVRDVRRGGSTTVVAAIPQDSAAQVGQASDLSGTGPRPVPLAVSLDGRSAAVAMSTGQVVSVDLGTGRTSAADCHCHPDRIRPLALDAAFAVFEGARVLLFEAGAEPRISFVPLRGAQ